METCSLLGVALTGITVSALAIPAFGDSAQSLAGEWRFATDPQDVGIAENWAGRIFENSIRLPGTTDEAGIGDLQLDTGKDLGVLVRKHNYLGASWYTRDIEIPADTASADWLLTLERVIWQSRVFVDGKELEKPQDSLCTPHVHHLGKLTPGRHHLAIRVDNRMIHPIGNKNHAYGEQTQSRWNGIVGNITLAPVSAITSLRIFTPTLDKVEIEIGFDGSAKGLQLRASIIDPADGRQIATSKPVPASTMVKVPVIPGGTITAWSEFSPKTYLARVELLRDGDVMNVRESPFGFRTAAHDGNQLLINGRPAFMRGNIDCIHFPKTGYPSTHKADWLAIFRKYREHNLNLVRFHSWCPPEAAFEAADELGIYIQAEGPIWIDGWMTAPNSRPEMDTEGYPKGLGKNDRTIDTFAMAEFRRILDTYGNHPSFLFFCFGNELGPSDFAVTGRWVGELKQHDPRHLYAASTARTITGNCDFNATHSIPGIGPCRQHYQFGTNWDYEDKYGRSPVPIMAHEIGQWPVYPDWKLCEKFTGTLRNTRLETMRRQAVANGVFDDQAEFTRASGSLNQRLYKDEIESFLRTPSCRGFQLLSLQDFQGQGEAYVGWLDCFWDSKETTASGDFRGYCAPVVALAKLPSYVFTDGDTLACELLVRNNGPTDLKNTKMTARIIDEKGTTLAESAFTCSAKTGEVVFIGKTGFALAAPHARRLTLVLDLEGKAEANTYPLWVYPKNLQEKTGTDTLVTREFGPEAEAALTAGKSVLIIANNLGDEHAKHCAAWMPLYWSVPFFPGQGIETLGLVVRDEHPAFADFPTGRFNDWQWQRLCSGARGFDLTGMVPESFKPIAQPVTDFHLNRKLGSIFECKVGKGKLLVCGYNLGANLPEARQLRHSILRYVRSEKFQPSQEIASGTLHALLKLPASAEISLPAGFENAGFYLIAAGQSANAGDGPAEPELNRVLLAQKNYKLTAMQADGTWKDDRCTAWHGRKLGFQLQVPSGTAGTLCVKFSDHNANGRTGKFTLEGRESPLGKHDEADGHWVKLDIMREDALDSKLIFSAECLTGPNLMITHVAFIPKG